MMSHELESAWLYIHPPIAMAGYVFVFVFTFLVFRYGTTLRATMTRKAARKMHKTDKHQDDRRWRPEFFGAVAWFFTLLGLITGMIWAQQAWGSYWTWDPKETMTLVLFIVFSFSLAAYYEKNDRYARMLCVVSCILIPLTAATSFIMDGLHSFR